MTSLTAGRIAALVGVFAMAGSLLGNAGADTRDLRSPDTLDQADATAIKAHRAQPGLDLRSPDARDAASAAHSGLASANALDPAVATAVQRSEAPQVIVVASRSTFDWTDAGLGAAGGFAIALLLGGTVALTQRARNGRLAV